MSLIEPGLVMLCRLLGSRPGSVDRPPPRFGFSQAISEALSAMLDRIRKLHFPNARNILPGSPWFRRSSRAIFAEVF
jgi:hypothetical protein